MNILIAVTLLWHVVLVSLLRHHATPFLLFYISMIDFKNLNQIIKKVLLEIECLHFRIYGGVAEPWKPAS